MPATLFQSQSHVLAPTLSAVPALVCILACLFSKRPRLPAWYLIGPITSSILGYMILRQLLSDFHLPLYILSLTPVLCGLLGIVLWYGRKIGEN